MMAHVEETHGAKLEVEILNFTSMGEFLSWKEKEEEVSHVYFSKQFS